VSEKETVSFKADPSQLRGVFSALKNLEKEANTDLKNKVTAISAFTGTKIQAAASSAPFSAQSQRVAQTVRPNKDKIPNITIGGSKARFSGGAVSGQVLFGNEFGSENRNFNGGRRFPMMSPPLNGGNEGYWIFPTLRKEQPAITQAWIAAVDSVLNGWSKG